jgi:hypothetical protein
MFDPPFVPLRAELRTILKIQCLNNRLGGKQDATVAEL